MIAFMMTLNQQVTGKEKLPYEVFAWLALGLGKNIKFCLVIELEVEK